MFRSTFLHMVDLFYGWIIRIGSNLQSLFLLWMRLTWGHQLILAGSGRLVAMDPVMQYFNALQLGMDSWHVEIIRGIEGIGGVLFCLGFLSRLTAIPVALVMIASLGVGHGEAVSHFQFLTNPSALVHEPPYPFLITALLLLCFGPGRISIDAWIKRWADKQPKY